MKILIISDTHGDEKILLEKLEKYPDFDNYFYLGDSELLETNQIFDKFTAVCGNMDYGDFPETELVNSNGINFLLTHGHLFGVNMGLDSILEEGRNLGANVICYGHTHYLDVNYIDSILLINPGSISQPRNFITQHGTYVILEIDDNSYRVFCYNRKDRLLDIEKNPLVFERRK